MSDPADAEDAWGLLARFCTPVDAIPLSQQSAIEHISLNLSELNNRQNVVLLATAATATTTKTGAAASSTAAIAAAMTDAGATSAFPLSRSTQGGGGDLEVRRFPICPLWGKLAFLCRQRQSIISRGFKGLMSSFGFVVLRGCSLCGEPLGIFSDVFCFLHFNSSPMRPRSRLLSCWSLWLREAGGWRASWGSLWGCRPPCCPCRRLLLLCCGKQPLDKSRSKANRVLIPLKQTPRY